MAVYLARVSIPYFTGIPEDVIVNTWHFMFPNTTPEEGDLSSLRDNLSSFYQTVYSVSGSTRFAPWVNPSGNTLDVYNVEEPAPRSPI